MRRLFLIVIVAVSLACAACSDPPDDKGDASKDTGPPADAVDLQKVACDSLDPFRCALPWPSNLYLDADESRTTGYELGFRKKTLPANKSDKHVDPAPYERLDGYGVGTPILVQFPNLDTSNIASRFDVGPSVEEDAPIVLLEVKEDGSTRRVPYWAELDARADDTPKKQLLMVRPAEILKENTRYVVAFRNLKKTDGSEIEASDSFAKLRDGETAPGSALAQRKARFEEVFGILEEAGVSRDSLTLAWDFHTASGEGIRGRMTQMRKKGLQAAPSQGPELAFEQEDVQEYVDPDDGGSGGSDKPKDDVIALEISGTFEVPKYTKDLDNGQRWALNVDADGNVQQNGTREASFTIAVPHTAVDKQGSVPVLMLGPLIYSESDFFLQFPWYRKLADEYGYVMIATEWAGMASGEKQRAIAAAQNLSNFQGIADRLHEGLLQFLLLARTAKNRVPAMDALTSRGVQVESTVHFYGAAVGAMYGQSLVALSKPISRGYMLFPAVNFSTLLRRSDNFSPFLEIFANAYPSPADRAIGIAAIQLLWSATDPVSYVGHLEQNPIVSGAGDDDVLMASLKGDPGLPVVSNEVVGRSGIGVSLMENYDADYTPWGIDFATYPHEESGIILFDLGADWPRRRNRVPDVRGGLQRELTESLYSTSKGRKQVDTFLKEGKIVDVCGGSPCSFGSNSQ